MTTPATTLTAITTQSGTSAVSNASALRGANTTPLLAQSAKQPRATFGPLDCVAPQTSGKSSFATSFAVMGEGHRIIRVGQHGLAHDCRGAVSGRRDL
jgi:hypothetical protein